MFDKILLAVDGSEHSNRAVAAVGELAAKLGSEVLVLNVREVGFAPRVGVLPKESAEESRTLVDDVVHQLTLQSVTARGESTEALRSGAAKGILDEAKAYGATLIVLGCQGHSELGGLLLGSVADKVIHHATSPVMAVR
jgi:nucleotide-binding universal stress UspA family protein